jgi:hypothetical protein
MALANDPDRERRRLDRSDFTRKPAPDLIRAGGRFPSKKDAIEPNR